MLTEIKNTITIEVMDKERWIFETRFQKRMER